MLLASSSALGTIEWCGRQVLLRVLGLTDLVAELGRTFVVFALDRPLEFLPQPGEVDLALHRHARPPASRRHLADMVGRAKWDAWNAVKGKSTDAAMQEYVDLIESLK